MEHQWFSTIDFQPPSLPSINSGLALVDQYKKRGESVYIHCKAGKGRSAVVTACYLVKVGVPWVGLCTTVCVCVCWDMGNSGVMVIIDSCDFAKIDVDM